MFYKVTSGQIISIVTKYYFFVQQVVACRTLFLNFYNPIRRNGVQEYSALISNLEINKFGSIISIFKR